MAQEALEKVDEHLNCSICLNTYTDPKILQCFHVYCRKCLIKLAFRDQQGQLSLSCPICRQVTPVPANGTAGLQSAFHINRLLEILDQHKKASNEPSRLKKDKRLASPNLAHCCPEHSEREVELFCETCEKLLCLRCVIKSGNHHSHDYKDINESFEKYKEQVVPSLEPMEKQISAITTVLDELDKCRTEIAHQQGTIEAKIRDRGRQLHKIIKERLIRQLDQITNRKLKSLASQRGQIETLHAQLSSCLEFTRESLKGDVQHGEVLVMKTGILKQVREVTAAFNPDILSLTTKADILFSCTTDAESTCENYGRVYTLDSPDPSKCVAAGRGTEEAMVGEIETVVVNVVSFEGETSKNLNSSLSFQVELVSRMTGSKECGAVEHSKEQGQYVVSYQPTVKGKHQLHIKADGQHIQGSPFNVAVMLPVEKLGIPIQILNDVKKPWGVAITGNGDVVVTESDGYRPCVSVFSPQGKKLFSFGSHGSGEGQFSSPSGVAVDKEGNIIVSDCSNHRIQKFTSNGSFQKALGSRGSGILQFEFPHDVAYNASNGHLYVADTRNDRIQILDSDFAFIRMFGRYGGSNGQLKGPLGIATDSTGNVYVSDSDNYRIQIFTAEGKYLKHFGREGACRGELNRPCSVTVDASGLVYVSINQAVLIFTSDGNFVASFGTKGKRPGQFDSPQGLAVDSSGVVHVCDHKNSRIQMF